MSVIIMKQMLVITILVLLGYALYKRKVMDDNTTKKVSILIVDICNPALALSCVIQDKIKATQYEILTACIVGAFILMIAMPGANLPMILAEKNGEDTSVLSQMILLTTIMSLVSVPVVMGE